jgi:hypothetical protein
MVNNLQIENALETVHKVMADYALEAITLSHKMTLGEFWKTHETGMYLLVVPSLFQTPGGPAKIHICILAENILKHATLDHIHLELLAVQKACGCLNSVN